VPDLKSDQPAWAISWILAAPRLPQRLTLVPLLQRDYTGI